METKMKQRANLAFNVDEHRFFDAYLRYLAGDREFPSHIGDHCEGWHISYDRAKRIMEYADELVQMIKDR